MNYTKATLFAATGYTLILPNYIGYFKWDYAENKLYFLNGDYKSYELGDDLKKRTDWFYIT